MLWDAKVGHQQFTGAWRGPALLFILFPPNWSCTSESVSPTKMPFCFKCCHTKVFGGFFLLLFFENKTVGI